MNYAHSKQLGWTPRASIGVDASFGEVAFSIAEVSEAQLRALTQALDWVPTIAPGLLVWLQHLVDWELRRRTGSYSSLRRPVMWAGEERESLIAATLFDAQFDCDANVESVPLRALFAAIVRALRANNAAAAQ
jgi:hypothetical protein